MLKTSAGDGAGSISVPGRTPLQYKKELEAPTPASPKYVSEMTDEYSYFLSYLGEGVPALGSFVGSDVTMRTLRTGGPALICRRTECIIRSIDRRASGQ